MQTQTTGRSRTAVREAGEVMADGEDRVGCCGGGTGCEDGGCCGEGGGCCGS